MTDDPKVVEAQAASETPLPSHPPPADPVPRKQLVGGVVALIITIGLGVGAVFGVNVCDTLASVGVHLDACPASATP
jgi:hypothetical protein